MDDTSFEKPHIDDTIEEEDTSTESVHEQGFLSKLALFFLEVIKIVVLAGIMIALIRYFLFKPFYVKGQSMEPTFYERDYLIIDEISYRLREPARGEIVVFDSPINDDHYLKRIIALPGERVKVENNTIIVYNDEHPRGWVLSEEYLVEDTPGSISLTLGEGQYFVMGDNRDASYDSRRFGAIDKADFVGRVWFRGWPFSRVSSFPLPLYKEE